MLCSKCKVMIPSLWRRVNYPCPMFDGMSPCARGLEQMERDRELEEKTNIPDDTDDKEKTRS